MLKKLLLGLLVLALLIGGAVGVMFITVDRKAKALASEIHLQGVDLAQIPDGTYLGEYGNENVFAKVQVTVSGQQITQIEILEHRHGMGSAGEQVVEAILREQTVLVDTISRATASSKTIAKAVEVGLLGN